LGGSGSYVGRGQRREQDVKPYLGLSLVVIVAAGLVVAFGSSSAQKSVNAAPVVRAQDTRVPVYIRNLSPRYYSDKEILNAIPAWTKAINKDFAPIWHTEQYRFVFLGRKPAPKGQIVATFVKSGPVQGALAYHTVDKGVPAIVVYTGTGVYYGYDNSVSFTHEIQELAADPTICVTNQGWPYDWINVVGTDGSYNRLPQAEGTFWATEVSDPVEAFSYSRKGLDGKPVAISDFVTPNWFADSVDGPYDFMHLVQQPYTILPGGYAQRWTGSGWGAIMNFRKGVASDAGFYKGEDLSRGPH